MGKRRVAKSKKVALRQMFEARLGTMEVPSASRFHRRAERRAEQRALAKLEKIRCK